MPGPSTWTDIPLYDAAYTLDSHPGISYESFVKPSSGGERESQWHEWWVNMVQYGYHNLGKPLV